MLKNVKSDRFATLPGVTKNYGGLDSSDTRTKTKKKIIEYEYYDEDYDYYDDFYVPGVLCKTTFNIQQLCPRTTDTQRELFFKN